MYKLMTAPIGALIHFMHRRGTYSTELTFPRGTVLRLLLTHIFVYILTRGTEGLLVSNRAI